MATDSSSATVSLTDGPVVLQNGNAGEVLRIPTADPASFHQAISEPGAMPATEILGRLFLPPGTGSVARRDRRARKSRRRAVARRQGGLPHRRRDRVLRDRPFRHARRDVDRFQPGTVLVRGECLGRARGRRGTGPTRRRRRRAHRRPGSQPRGIGGAVRGLHGPAGRSGARTCARRRLRRVPVVGHAVRAARCRPHRGALRHRRPRRVVPAAPGPGPHACDDPMRMRRQLPTLPKHAPQLRPRLARGVHRRRIRRPGRTDDLHPRRRRARPSPERPGGLRASPNATR